jgi:hypothetical protein
VQHAGGVALLLLLTEEKAEREVKDDRRGPRISGMGRNDGTRWRHHASEHAEVGHVSAWLARPRCWVSGMQARLG